MIPEESWDMLRSEIVGNLCHTRLSGKSFLIKQDKPFKLMDRCLSDRVQPVHTLTPASKQIGFGEHNGIPAVTDNDYN